MKSLRVSAACVCVLTRHDRLRLGLNRVCCAWVSLPALNLRCLEVECVFADAATSLDQATHRQLDACKLRTRAAPMQPTTRYSTPCT